jgi:hypothetical protein
MLFKGDGITISLYGGVEVIVLRDVLDTRGVITETRKVSQTMEDTTQGMEAFHRAVCAAINDAINKGK